MKNRFSYDRHMIRKLPVVMGLVILVVIMIITNPTRTDFYTWLESQYGIHVSYDINETTYTQIMNGQEKVLISEADIYSMRESLPRIMRLLWMLRVRRSTLKPLV